MCQRYCDEPTILLASYKPSKNESNLEGKKMQKEGDLKKVATDLKGEGGEVPRVEELAGDGGRTAARS